MTQVTARVFRHLVAARLVLIALVLDREAAAATPDPRTATLLSVLTKCTFGLAALLLGILLAIQRLPELTADNGDSWAALNLAMGTTAGLLSLTGYLLLARKRAAGIDALQRLALEQHDDAAQL